MGPRYFLISHDFIKCLWIIRRLYPTNQETRMTSLNHFPQVVARVLRANRIRQPNNRQSEKKKEPLTAAARSICAGPALTAESFGRDGKTGGGLDDAGIAGFAPILGTTGLEPTGLGLLAKGGGILFEDSFELSVTELKADFFQGVEVPLAGAIPGNTETGFAKASDVTDVGTILGAGGVLRGGADEGGGGTECGGTSSR